MVIANNHYDSYCRANEFYVFAGARAAGSWRHESGWRLFMKAFSLESSKDPDVRRLSAEQSFVSLEALPALNAPARSQVPRIAVKVKGEIRFICLSDVVAVQAQGNYVLLQRETNSYLLRDSISVVAERLDPFGFIRIHRSVLVNASFVEVIRPCSTGEFGLLLKGGKKFTVTRTYKNNLRFLAQFWIGTKGGFPQ